MSGDPERDQSHGPTLRIRVTPEPDTATMIAIVAALRHVRQRRQVIVEPPGGQAGRVGRWGRVGRREAMANRELGDVNESRRW